MKKTLLAVAALSSVAGIAQADVTLYGVLDAAIGTASHQYNLDPSYSQSVNIVTPTKAPNTVTGLLNGGIQNSRWGITGSEDLGDGRKAFFTLESGVNLPSGSLSNHAQAVIDSNNGTLNNATGSSVNGQLFGRQSFVGLSDATLGSLQFGRSYAPIYDILTTYDPVQFAVLFSPLAFSSTYGGGGGVAENVRQDNSVKYTNRIGDVKIGALYKLGNQSGSTSAQSAYAFRLGYETEPFGIQAAYQAYTDAISGAASATPGAIAVTESNTKAILLTAKYKFTSDLTGKAGYERFTLSAPSNSYTLATYSTYSGYPVSSISLVTAERSTEIYFAGGDYNLTSALNLAVGYYSLNFDAYGSTASGNVNLASALLDYHLSKRSDVYAGYINSTPGGARYVNYPSNNLAAVGFRHAF